MTAPDYTTSTDVLNEVPEGNFSSSDLPNLGFYITAASRLIDRKIGKPEGYFFAPGSSDPVTLYYDGSNDTEQEIDAFAAISEVAVSEQGGVSSSDYTVWAATDYILLPYNYATDNVPITKLAVDFLNGSKPVWYSYPRSVRITGQPGYSTSVPTLIEQAVRVQVIRWMMRAKNSWADNGAAVTIGSMTFKGAQMQLDPDVVEMIKPFILEASLD